MNMEGGGSEMIDVKLMLPGDDVEVEDGDLMSIKCCFVSKSKETNRFGPD